MKKIIVIIQIFILTAIFVSCSNNVSSVTPNSYISYTSEYMNNEYYLFENADHIVKAKLVDIGSWGGLAVYEYKVKTVYKGDLQDETIIHVYDAEDEGYKKGRKYYLFLEDDKDVDGIDHAVYTSIIKNKVFSDREKEFEYGHGEYWYSFKAADIPDMISEAEILRVEREKMTEAKQDAISYVEAYITGILENEKSAGNLASYDIVETVYDEYLFGPEAGWYNVVCSYDIEGGSENNATYTVGVEKRFLYNRNEETGTTTLSETSYSVTEENRMAKYDYPSKVPYSPQILKKDASNKKIEQIGEELVTMFLEYLCRNDIDCTFRLTGYKDINVESVVKTNGTEWKENYWYSGEDILPEGAVNCWVLNEYFSWKYTGYIKVFGLRGEAIYTGSSESWINAVFQDSGFFMVEYPGYYALYTERNLPS